MAIAGVLEIQMMANMARLSDDMRRAERVVGDSMGKVEKSVASASRALSTLGMGLSIGLIADQMRRTVDAYTKIDAQLRLSTKSQREYNQALSDVRRISTIAQSDISATTMLYTRLLNTTEGMGISQGKLATVTETVSFGLKAYGATSAEAASAALQLSQAMGANRLGGEEFRAVMEAMPNVMKVLADSMGVPLGELRALSIAGKITTAEMVKAFGDPKVAEMFKKMAENAQTVTGAWTVARNEFVLFFGEFAKTSGLTATMIASFKLLGDTLRVLGQYIGDIIMLFTAWAALRITQAVYGYIAALMAQRAAALAAAQAEMARMNMTYGASAASVAATRTALAHAAANTTLAGSFANMGRSIGASAAANGPMIAVLALAGAVVTLKNSFEDSINPTGKFLDQIRSMGLEALITARQLEEAKLASMWFKKSFNEREARATEDRIRMLNAQIGVEKKLRDEEKIRTTGTGSGSDKLTLMQKMTNELRAQNEADLAGKLNNVERVQLAWQNGNKKTRGTERQLDEALLAARMRDQDILAGRMADSIINAAKSGNVGQAIRVDIQATFERDVLQPQIKAILANTLATEANTAATKSGGTGGSGGMMGGGFAIIFAAVLMFMDRQLSRTKNWTGDVRTAGTATRSGFIGRLERDLEYAGTLATITGTIGTAKMNMLNAAVADITTTYAAAGDAVGIADVRTKQFSATINTAGDVTAALSDAIGMQLVPALALFQREGETLQQTAIRMTETFKATNDFIAAMGVSQGAAFGGFGLGGAAGRDALIAASGGLQQFNQNAQNFIKNFLTPAQQMQPALDAVGRTFAKLGITGVSTNEQFAALVKQQTELGNMDTVAQLLSVSDAFNSVTKSAADANAQLQALLDKNRFGTLVDYIRATNAGAVASGLIASATAASSALIGKETKSSMDFLKDKALPSLDPTADMSAPGWNDIPMLFEKLLKHIVDIAGMMSDLNKMVKGMWDSLASILEAFIRLPQTLLDALKNNTPNLPSPDSSLLPPIPSFGLWANGGAFGLGGIHAFANGAAFTNGIYNTPTPFMFANGAGFSAGVMGEAGDEAVMPLRRGSDGRLGVSMHGGSEVAAEVRALRDEVNMMRRDNQAGQAAIATATQRSYKLLDRWNGEGMPEVRAA